MAKLNKLQTATLPDAVLDRRQAVPALIENPGDFLMVAGLAGTAWELSALTHESPSLFGLGGAMGAAPMMGLGWRWRSRSGACWWRPATANC